MAHISLHREATVFIFKDPSGWQFPKWIWMINKMNQSQKSYSLKNFMWWNWFWQSARSKTLHLVSSDHAIDREEKTLKIHAKKDFLKKMKINWGTFLFRRDL